MAGQRESRTAGAELGLQILAHFIGPVVRCGVRIAILQDVQRPCFGRMRKLLEEWNQGARAFERTHGLRGSRADGLERDVAHQRVKQRQQPAERASCG